MGIALGHSSLRGIAFAALVTLVLALPLSAHQLVLMTGYANSRTPETGPGVDSRHSPFRAGGGYAFTVRADVDSRNRRFWFGPSLAFWNNLTGDPDPNANSSYLQLEFGGRLFVRTRSVPSLYGGVGAGYTFSHGEVIAKVDGSKQTFDGDFPTASVHFGVKSPGTTGLSVIAEGSYHFGLDQPTGRLAVGPAKAWLVQIGIGLDMLLGPQP